MRIQYFVRIMAVLCIGATTFIACGDDDDDTCDGEGFTRCLNAFPPDQVTRSDDGAIQTLEWEPSDDGPLCVGGGERGEYRSFIREGAAGNNDLTIYMPNDGAWLVESDSTLYGSKGRAPRTFNDITKTNFTSSRHAAIEDSDFLYISACDGSLYLGDKDYTTEELIALGAETDNNKKPRFYRGFLNVTASINELARQNPNPERVFLFGTLAGGYGVIGAAIHTAETFPDADIFILQDGSPGMGMGDVDTTFVDRLTTQWGVGQSISAGAETYLEGGHIVPLLLYVLEKYDNVYAATFASVQEASIRATIKLALGEDLITLPIYECFVKTTLEDIREKAPDGRYQYYVVDAAADNMGALRDGEGNEVGEDYVLTTHDGSPGISVDQWLEQFINKDQHSEWTSYSEVEMSSDVACKDAE